LLALSLSNALWAAEDCAFDQEHQRSVLAAVAKQHPGAELLSEQRQIIWTHPGEGTTTFGYGGCADLGSFVIRNTPLPAPRTREQVILLAEELATEFWSNQVVSNRLATKTLVSALQNGRFTVETVKGKELFRVSDPNFVELYVEHQYKDGVDTLAIAWQGAF
jgi:hypothetical protein